MEKILFKPVWFDSLGAKSSCTLIRTPDVRILIDPGVAIMHPGFPASQEKKVFWFEKGLAAIRSAAKKADIIVISHYHYDHFIDFEKEIYQGKIVLAKNPNIFINDSQRGRAEAFFKHLYEAFGAKKFEEVLEKPKSGEYEDPTRSLAICMKKDFKDYSERRRVLLNQGRKWFFQRVKKWNRYRWIPELDLDKVKVRFPEGKEFSFGDTRLKFTSPLFHGIEFSRVGWVFSTIVEYGNMKLIHSSDLNGPIIEDYAEIIVREDPDILILDGPMTYMLGYTLNMTNFRRTVENALKIVEETKAKIIIYDHHLPREPKFRERTIEVWEKAKKLGKKIYTAAEFLGKKPAVLS